MTREKRLQQSSNRIQKVADKIYNKKLVKTSNKTSEALASLWQMYDCMDADAKLLSYAIG